MTGNSKAEEVRLMDFSHGAGCGCKIGPEELHGVLGKFQGKSHDSRVLVGFDTGDDAAVVQIAEDIAIVQTTDFFTPILNDPYRFGQVAAANAISDVYAMGGKPLSALSLVAFPLETLGKDVLSEIMRGGIEKCREAGIEIVGGHSIDDPEPKFGLAVTGTIHPKKIIRNRGVKPGDILILTKPIGTGILTTAIKRNYITQDWSDRVFRNMAALNIPGGIVLEKFHESIHAATDITGFGLTGHLFGMLKNSGCLAKLEFDKIPLLPGVYELLEKKSYPGGTKRNFKYVEEILSLQNIAEEKRENSKLILCDPQTSGGILMSVAPGNVDEIIENLKENHALSWSRIGELEESDEVKIIVK